jgi:hypothetical protein
MARGSAVQRRARRRENATKGRTPAPTSCREAPESEPLGASRLASRETAVDTALRLRARQIISDLETTPDRQATTLEEWMAHYVAELMHRTTNAALSRQERTQAERDCADVVLRLEELRLARDQAQVGYWIYSSERHSQAPAPEPALREALGDPIRVRSWPIWRRLVATFELAAVEQELVRVVVLQTLLNQVDGGRTKRGKPKSSRSGDSRHEEGARERFSDPTTLRAHLKRAVTAAATLFPEIADAKTARARSEHLVAALQQGLLLRSELLDRLPRVESRHVPQVHTRATLRTAARTQPKRRVAPRQRG